MAGTFRALYNYLRNRRIRQNSEEQNMAAAEQTFRSSTESNDGGQPAMIAEKGNSVKEQSNG